MSDFYDNDFINPEESSNKNVNETINETVHETSNEESYFDAGEIDTTYHYSYRNSQDDQTEDQTSDHDAVYEKYQKRKKKKEKRMNFSKKLAKVAAYGLVFGLVAGAAFTGVNYGLGKMGLNSKSSTQLAATQTVSTNSSGGTQTDVSAVAKSVLPAVVSITGTFQMTNYGYFGQQSSSESEGSGSGIIVGKDKKYIYIATNNHVVEDATSLAVGFCDDSTVEAEIKGTDSDSDLAVVTVDLNKVDSKTLKEIQIITEGDSDDLVVGEQAIAIGNALGYGQSVTAGYISAVNREVELTDKTMTLIQTDAAINPGNSGGALLNSKGELIGINTVKYASEEVEGMGYAIPINTAKTIIDDLINEKTIAESEQAYLGISGRDISGDMAQAYGMPSGIYVSEVMQSSPAQSAGIQAGDIIVEFDGSSVTTMESLQNKISKKTAGTKVKIKVKRQSRMGDYSEKTLTITLGKKSQMQSQSWDSQN
ncbi:MAG: trypsin-like peptidase domain-containing protein [Lachnospiraceae bacterium]|nr:trypsin-like peptidase domain-containing protein [Lachnospiraceae bacterium]